MILVTKISMTKYRKYQSWSSINNINSQISKLKYRIFRVSLTCRPLSATVDISDGSWIPPFFVKVVVPSPFCWKLIGKLANSVKSLSEDENSSFLCLSFRESLFSSMEHFNLKATRRFVNFIQFWNLITVFRSNFLELVMSTLKSEHFLTAEEN